MYVIHIQHAGSTEIFARGGVGPGSDCQKTTLKTLFVVVFLALNLFTVLKRVSNGHFKDNYNIPRFERGGQHFPGGGSNFYQGVQMLVSIEIHITFICTAAQTEENSHCFHCGTSDIYI